MSDEAKKTEKTSWFQGLKAEFKNISWPDRKTHIRESITVTVVSVVLGVIIATLDMVLQYGINFLVQYKGKGEYMSELNWYVVHTISGYENKVKANIEKTIEIRQLQDQIFEVRVPLQDVVEMKGGVKKNVSQKMFPGYVLVNMVMNDDTWYVVRNTRGVTGFVGPGSKPVPLTDEEMKPLGIKDETVRVDFAEGDTVVVTGGAWKETTGVVTAINPQKQLVTSNVEMFGRETPVVISFAEVQKM